jgi:peptidyl-prolyl cis-trans isomerase D
MKASAFAGQNKNPQAFDKAATDQGLQKRSAPGVRPMDNYVMGLPAAREMVRWAFAENSKIGEVSPVFDLSGKYGIAVLKAIGEKGQQSLASVKARIEPSVRNMKKIDMLAEKMKKELAGTKDIAGLAQKMNAKIDTSMVTFTGFGRSNIGREQEIVGKLFASKKGEMLGPLTGNYGVFAAYIQDVIEAPAREDFTFERSQQMQSFAQRIMGSAYTALEKTAKITDSRINFY